MPLRPSSPLTCDCRSWRLGLALAAGAILFIIILAPATAWRTPGSLSVTTMPLEVQKGSDDLVLDNTRPSRNKFSVYAAAELLSIGAMGEGSPAFWRPALSDLMPPEKQVADRAVAVGDGLDILLLGDSVDRMTVTDGCAHYRGVLDPWGQDVITYNSGNKFGSGLCKATWGTLGFAHLFGARPTGPYIWGADNRTGLIETTARLDFVIRHYNKSFAKLPDVVVYQSNLWDGVALADRYNETSHRSSVINQYMNDIVRNCKQIMAMLSDTSVLLLRTTPAYRLPLTRELNSALRVVASRKNIGLLDWDAMTGGIHNRSKVFRDHSHPNVDHTRGFASTLVRFATYLTNSTILSLVISA